MADYFWRILESGFFTFLGVIVTLYSVRSKTQAETRKLVSESEKSKAEVLRLKEETENLQIEHQTRLLQQNNELMRQLDNIHKTQKDIEAQLFVTNQEKQKLVNELAQTRIEYQEQQKKLEQLLAVQQKDISKIVRQTGQLPNREDLSKNIT
jgi:DNA repair exonuclease SbcCD ATPase subunit